MNISQSERRKRRDLLISWFLSANGSGFVSSPSSGAPYSERQDENVVTQMFLINISYVPIKFSIFTYCTRKCSTNLLKQDLKLWAGLTVDEMQVTRVLTGEL